MAYGRGYEKGTRKQRTPSKRTLARQGQIGAAIAATFIGKTPEEMLALALRPVWQRS